MSEVMSEPSVEGVMGDAATSDWLKTALQGALERDPVDALNDALALAAALEERLRTVLQLGAEA